MCLVREMDVNKKGVLGNNLWEDSNSPKQLIRVFRKDSNFGDCVLLAGLYQSLWLVKSFIFIGKEQKWRGGVQNNWDKNHDGQLK